MTKIAVILVLLGLTVMASAYSLSGPRFNGGLQTGQQNEQAYLQDQGRENFEACIICLLLEISHFSSTAYLQEEDAAIMVYSMYNIPKF